jgi:segregation and condensation protein A
VPAQTIAEFAAVGARLVLLKSRSLLPRPPTVEEEADPEELVRQLVAYRSVKEGAQHLAMRDVRGEGAFAPGVGSVALPEVAAPPRLAVHQSNALVRALRRRLSAVPDPRTAVSRGSLVSLREMVSRVLTVLSERYEVRFDTIAGRDRHEVMTAFLALLVLIRRRVVDAEQATTFGAIVLRRLAPVSTPLDAPAADAAADD